MLVLPILLGLAACVLAAFLPRRIAPLAGAAAAVACLAIYWQAAPAVIAGQAVLAPFWSLPALGLSGGLRLDGLSLLFVTLIAGIGAFIFLYARRYLEDDERLRRLTVMLLAFMTAMLGAVTADDVIVLFIFWELTSLTSFFLVGFDHEKPQARHAALQALLITAGGGLSLLAGVILVAVAAGTTSLTGIIAAREAVLAAPAALPAMLLILGGCFTKSAQVPFHFWLPNAMAAPTPVSAYLHSATMVKLGIYLMARCNPLYQDEAAWQSLLACFGAATALTASVLSLRETDLKRILAHTTVAALGTLTMLIGAGTGPALLAAVLFLVVHALYKASLFLVAGAVDHETGLRDASRLGGLRRAMPLTAAAAILASLSMAGLPPMLGFVAKEAIYESVGGSMALAVAAFLINVATVAIAGVFGIRLFFGARPATPQSPHDPPPGMLAGPLTLAVLGLLAGLFPAVVDNALVRQAVAVVMGAPVRTDLVLWHGFTPVLLASVVTVACGLLLCLAWPRVRTALHGAKAIDRYSPSAAYEVLLAGFISGSARLTDFIQHGDLRGYLRVLFGVTAAGVLFTLLARQGVAMPALDWAGLDVRVLTFAGLCVGAVATMLAPTVFSAVIAVGLVGFCAALVFLVFGAPDLAFTQFSVETLMVVIMATTLIGLPTAKRDIRTRRSRLVDGAIAAGLGTAVTLTLLAVLDTPFDDRLSDWFGEHSVAAAHGHNVVNVILVDFRALDTLGELTVLSIAAFGVTALLRAARKDRAP